MALVDLMSVMNILPEPEAQRPDYAEKRLCMAMIRDVIGTLDEIALNKPIKKQSKLLMFKDTIAWVKGEHPASCELTFEKVCDVLGWAPGFVGPELLKRAKGIKPKIKVGTLHQERGVMARRLGVFIKRRKPATANHGGLGVTSVEGQEIV